MKNILYIIFASFFVALTSCEVDDYQGANPPSLLDAPAVYDGEIDKTLLSGGEIATIVLKVSDAPAGITSATVSDVDYLGVPAGGSYALISGSGEGDIVIEYTAPDGFSGSIDLSVWVSDSQVDEKGEDASKSSVPVEFEVSAVCGTLSGGYNAEGTILVDDFGSGPYNYIEPLSLVSCGTEGSYAISDISGGLYTNAYADNYGASPRAAVLDVDATSNVVTWAAVSDQFGGTIIQDPAQPDSNYDPSTSTFTIYWTATAYGERGVLVMTK